MVNDENPFYASWFAVPPRFLNAYFYVTVFAMAVRLISVGKLTMPFLRDAEAEYLKRLKPHLRIVVTELNNSRVQESAQAINDEGARILELIKPRDQLIALDENGESISSVKFAKTVEKFLAGGDVVFVIGGAFGLSAAVRKRANFTLSLSALTFTYQFARVVLIEQLYRATCINRGVDYNK